MESINKQQDIADLRRDNYITKRVSVSAMEDLLYNEIPVLDHGFVRVIDYMGNDSAVVQAARVSYGRGTKQQNQDRGLIRYLMRHRHTTPFEMCEIKLHIKLPIFIARQWIRHRTANVNEYSARYSILDKEFYLPNADHLAAQSTTNMQGREMLLPKEQAAEVLEMLKNDSTRCYANYMHMMNLDEATDEPLDPNRMGVARELARMNLTLNYYTQWYWKVDLHNLLHFLALRADSHAQYEIRAYADAILEVVKQWVPFTYEAFVDYRLQAVHLSKQMKDVVKRMLQGEKVDLSSSGLTSREWGEMWKYLDLPEPKE